jgi:hypothetical protein
MKLHVKQDYVRLRRHEYPSMGDQLDAIWKGGAEADAMRKRIEEVKAKYPKPSVSSEKKS